jgi:hypothetical protein
VYRCSELAIDGRLAQARHAGSKRAGMEESAGEKSRQKDTEGLMRETQSEIEYQLKQARRLVKKLEKRLDVLTRKIVDGWEGPYLIPISTYRRRLAKELKQKYGV